MRQLVQAAGGVEAHPVDAEEAPLGVEQPRVLRETGGVGDEQAEGD